MGKNQHQIMTLSYIMGILALLIVQRAKLHYNLYVTHVNIQ